MASNAGNGSQSTDTSASNDKFAEWVKERYKDRFDVTKVYYKEVTLTAQGTQWKPIVERRLSRLEDKPVKVVIFLFSGRGWGAAASE